MHLERRAMLVILLDDNFFDRERCLQLAYNFD